MGICGEISFGQRRTNDSKACKQYSRNSSSSTRLYLTTNGITFSRCSPILCPAWRLTQHTIYIQITQTSILKTNSVFYIQQISSLCVLYLILQNSSVTSVTLHDNVCDVTFLWRQSSSSSSMTKAIHCRQYFAVAADAVKSQKSRHGAERRDGLYNRNLHRELK